MVRVEQSRPSPESKKFNPADFPIGTDIVFFDDKNKEWKVGTVNNWANPASDSEGNITGNIITIDRGLVDLTMSKAPKKIDKIPGMGDLLNINGQNYRVDIRSATVVQDTGEVEISLVNTANPRDRLNNVNLKTIKNLESVQSFEQSAEAKIRDLKDKIQNKADVRGKEILSELAELQKKVIEAGKKLGSLSEWSDLDEKQSAEIGAEIKNLQKEVNDALAELNRKLDGIKPRVAGKETLAEEASGLQARLDRNAQRNSQASKDQHKQDVRAAKDAYAQWKIDKADWEKKKKAREKWEKDGKGDEPADPGDAPAEPQKPEDVESPDLEKIKMDSAFALFEELDSPTTTGKHKELVDKVKERANKQAQREGFSGYEDPNYVDHKEQVVAEILLAVLAEEKVKVATEGEKFDLKAEKEDLKTKIKAIIERAKAVGMRPVADLDVVERDWLQEVNNIADTLPQADQEKEILKHWELLAKQEVRVYEAERAKLPQPEKETVENDIDIPDTVLRELFSTRQPEVRVAMEAIYNEEMKAGDERADNEIVLAAVKKLMAKAPDEYLMKKLRQYGIKNWDQFKNLWDKKMAKKAVGVLHEWGQADLKTEIAKQIGAWDTIKALGWQLGARIATNIALVGGGAAVATAVFASGGLAGVALAAAGGAAGGGVRALLQKFIFGSKTLEDRKQKALAELYDKKRQQIIKDTLDKRFGGAARGNLVAETNVIFSSIMAQAIRTASEEMVKGEGEDFASAEARTLKGDEKRLYVQALKNARESGVELTQDQKIKMAVALQHLTRRGDQSRVQAVKESDPLVIKMVDGVLAGYSGSKASSENYGADGAVGTVALGAAAGAAFFSNSALARGVMGGLSGAAVGYKMGESMRSKREVKQAESAFAPRFQRANNQWEIYSSNPDALDMADLKQFGDEIKSFNRYLKGEADTVDEQKLVALLQSNPQLRQQTENLVYQAYRRGVFARITLAEMQKHGEEVAAESNIKLADSTKAWLKKKTWQTGSVLVGAAAGATFSVLAGRGVQEFVKDIRHGVFHDYGHSEAPVIHRPGVGAEAKGTVAATAVENNPAAGRTVYTGPEHPAPAPEPAPVATHEVAAPTRPAGLVEVEGIKAGEKISFDHWRHKIMEGMGYKFEHGKIEHALRFHPGAKFELVDSKGNTVAEFEFKKGDSTWRALDHLHSKANHLLKAGEVPAIKVVGFDNHKVEILDNYKVEGHGAKQLDWSGEKRTDIHDLPKNNFDTLHLPPADQTGKFVAHDGLEYEQVPGGKDADYYLRDNHLYTFEGKYIGEQYASGAGKTTWSKGGTISEQDHKDLQAMLSGTKSEMNIIGQGGGPKDLSEGTKVAVADQKAVATGADGAKPAEAVAPAADVTISAADVHKGEYEVWGDIKKDIVSVLSTEEKINFSGDKAQVMSRLVDRVNSVLSDSPKLLDNSDIKSALTAADMPTQERFEKILLALGDTHKLDLTPEEKIVLGGNLVKDENFVELKGVSHGGRVVDAIVAKRGSHAVSYIDQATGRIDIVTDRKANFDPDNFDAKSLKGGGSNIKITGGSKFRSSDTHIGL